MPDHNRHFGKYVPNGEEVVIIGYRKKTNDVLVVFPSAMSQQESQDLRRIVQTNEAQQKDFLMDVVGGSILQGAHHPSGTDWQTYLIKQAATGRSQAVRKITMKDLTFYDQSQHAFFSGYGPSIEPEVDALRKTRIDHQDAALNGRPMPAPVAPITAPVPEAAPAAPEANADLTSALTAIAQGQAAILEVLGKMNKPAKAKTPTKKPVRRRVAAKRKPVAKKDQSDDVAVSSGLVETSTETPTVSDGV